MMSVSSNSREVILLTNAQPASGVGYYAFQIRKHMPDRYGVKEYFIDGQAGMLMNQGLVFRQLMQLPTPLNAKTVNWIRLGVFLRRILRRQHADSIVHATNQTLSFVTQDFTRSVVTVHDLIELTEPQSWGGYLSSRYLYSGIKKAQHIVAVSEYTSRCVQEYLGVPFDRISVIANGVGEEFGVIPDFEKTLVGQSFRHELRLAGDVRIVLYVGSEHRRKNVITALRAFAYVRAQGIHVRFLKVGEPGILLGRDEIMREIDNLGIRDDVTFLGHVTEERLCELYNLADVFIYPSRMEGFGLPPLQAMACGTPVVASDATALPEVVGDAALLRSPDDVDGFGKDLQRVLEDDALAADLTRRGIERVKLFSWEKAAKSLAEVYDTLL
jgi:glycosyltransferase involved in cell wall biosynthesis